MSTVGERVAWRSRVENADQRLLLTALGMLADDQLKVSFSLPVATQRYARQVSAFLEVKKWASALTTF